MKYILPVLRQKISLRLTCATLSIVILFAGFWQVMPAQAATGINDTINFQGKLVDDDGLNVADSTYSVVFSLYDVSSGGVAIWTETQSVETTDGLFQVHLGEITDLPGSVDFNTDNLYLGIKVGADAEMTPRIRFAAVPYAFNAQKVAGLTVTDTTGTLTIPNGKTIQFADAFTTTGGNALTLATTGTTSLTLPTTGTLLTNTAAAVQTITSTQASGTVLGIADSTNITGATTGLAVTLSGTGAFDQTGLSFNLSGASGSNLNDIVGTGNSWKVSNSGALTVASCTGCGGGTNYWRLDQGAFSPINDTADLLLGGISSSSAKFKFSPSGTSPTASVSARTSSAAMIVDNTGVGDLFTASKSGATKFVIDNSGNVGIGTTTPQAQLHVAGLGRFSAVNTNDGFAAYSPDGTKNAGFQWDGGQIVLGATGQGMLYSAISHYFSGGSVFLGSNTLYGSDIDNGDLTLDSTVTGTKGKVLINPSGGTVGIGTSNPLATLDVRGKSGTTPVASVSGQTASAGFIVDNAGNGDLFTASSSGLNRFVVKQNGNVGIGTTTPASALDVNGTIISRGPDGSFTTYAQDNSGNYYTLYSSAGELAFYNGAIRGALTGSGQLGLGFNNNVPLAQLDVQADTFSLPGGYIHGSTGKATLTLNQTSGSGDLFTASQSGSTKFVIRNDGSVGIGTTIPQGSLDVRAVNATQSVASISGATNFAAMVVNNDNSGDIFTASKSGESKFTVKNSGAVQINNLVSCGGIKTDATGILSCDTDMHVLGEATLGSAATTISFSVTAKEHMACYLETKGQSAVNDIGVRFNNDSGGTSYQHSRADSSGGANTNTANDTKILFTNGTTTNPVSAALEITNFSNTQKVVHGTAGIATTEGTHFQGRWNNTAAQITTVTFMLGAAGNFNTASHAWCEGRDVADYAENYYTTDTTVKAADVMTYDPNLPAGVKKSTKAYDDQLMGVVSTKPAYTLDDSIGYGHGWSVPIALSGRVPVKVSTENGPIVAGDNLTSSSIPGVAMKATRSGGIIGRAMDSYANPDKTAIGQVMLFVNTTWYDPDVYLADIDNVSMTSGLTFLNGATVPNSLLAYSVRDRNGQDVTRNGIYLNLAAGNIKAGSIDVQGLTIAGRDVNKRLDQLEALLQSVTFTASGSAQMFSLSKLEGLDGLEEAVIDQQKRIAVLEDKLGASVSATPIVSVTTASNSAIAQQSTQMDNLSVAGLATVSANLRVQGNGLVEGILNVVDTLTVGNFIVNKVATFFADAIFHSDVFIRGTAYFNADTVGHVTIQKGNDKAEVKFSKPYKSEPVINATVVTTKISDEQFKTFSEEGLCDKDADKALCEQKVTKEALAKAMPYVIASQSTDGFTILLSQPAAQDLTFSWSALAVIQAEEISLKGGDR